MKYGKTFATRLPPELAQRVHEFANENEVGESSVLRLAVKHFFKKDRDTQAGLLGMAQSISEPIEQPPENLQGKE